MCPPPYPREGVSSIASNSIPTRGNHCLDFLVNYFFAVLYSFITYVNILKLYMIVFC